MDIYALLLNLFHGLCHHSSKYLINMEQHTTTKQLNYERASAHDNFKNENGDTTIRMYKKRWLILFIYVLYSATNAMQWLEYCIIINIVKKYYNVSDSAVDWTSMVTMISYAPFVLPSTYVVYKKVRYLLVILF